MITYHSRKMRITKQKSNEKGLQKSISCYTCWGGGLWEFTWEKALDCSLKVSIWSEVAGGVEVSEMKAAKQAKTGVRNIMRPKGTIHSCLLLGWYLISQKSKIKPPTMLIKNDTKHAIHTLIIFILVSFSAFFYDPLYI